MPVPSLGKLRSSSRSFPALRCRHLGRHRVSSLSLLDLIIGLSCVFSVSSAAFDPAPRTRAVPTTRPLWRGPASLVVPQEGRGHLLLSVPLVDACEFLNDMTMVFTSLGCLLAPCLCSVSSAAFDPAPRTRAVPTTRPLWRGPASLVVPQEGQVARVSVELQKDYV
ncbi:hypothetical protein EDB85DRAFT_2142794 [Lactarius pseudohatsudake]|nr:hypothetical protein EDB85DRAFT_2152108 [Lactarius pseudohatsudake]KAH9021832.1 hypothetical protein EDB85DRAFT_2152126 [Lactarius pseudohatsudake]KAH9036995.1 hypothetical protein EDB85DRAFT_2142794 [Lactarius pseudohatsudake]